MPYLIDGHNLIGQLPDISLDDPNDEALLVQKLSGFAARTGKRCVVVFDTGLPGGKSRMSTRSVEVVFASTPANADKFIMDRIRKTRDPANWILVSSDNMVLEAAQRKGMKTLRSTEFAAQMRPQPKPKKDGEKPAMDVYVSPAEVEEWLKLFGKKK
jgi:uncharacterized protein